MKKHSTFQVCAGLLLAALCAFVFASDAEAYAVEGLLRAEDTNLYPVEAAYIADSIPRPPQGPSTSSTDAFAAVEGLLRKPSVRIGPITLMAVVDAFGVARPVAGAPVVAPAWEVTPALRSDGTLSDNCSGIHNQVDLVSNNECGGFVPAIWTRADCLEGVTSDLAGIDDHGLAGFETSQYVRITVYPTEYDADLDLEVYDALGVLIESDDSFLSSATVSFWLEAGAKYLLRVKAWHGSWPATGQSYKACWEFWF